MFILVNHSSDYGMSHCGNFDAHEKAWEYIADAVQKDYDVAAEDLMSDYPFDKGYIERDDNSIQVFAGYDYCSCYARDYNDSWIIIEV